MGAIVRAEGLRKSFGDLEAVAGIDISIEVGERVGIVGPNGAGKTTTLLMLLGAIDPDEGTVDLVGHRLPAGRSAAMQSVGFAAGYLPLPDRLKVHEALRFFAELSGVAAVDITIAGVLAELQIEHLRDKLCMTLSSGQATLVGIAKAVLHNPRVIVLDEPTASLDPDVAFRVRERLARLNEEHQTTLLLTSHDMREVETLTDRVIFLRAGRIIADGPPAAVVAEAGFASLEDMFMAEARRLRDRQV